jgi:glutamine cyclotransferase
MPGSALWLRAAVTCLALLACNGSDPANGNGDDADNGDSGEIPFWSYRVVNAYPHDPTAYTQGLLYVDGRFLEGTGGGRRLTSADVLSSLRWVDVESGTVEQQVTLDEEYFGEGVTLLDGRIYQLTWRSRTGFVWNPDLTPVRTFAYAEGDTTGWGLTDDGEHLWMSDGSSWLTRRDPDSFAVLERVQVHHGDNTVRGLNELEWIEGEIWANIYRTEIVARIDPTDGAVVGWVDLRGLLTDEEKRGVDVLNGIAYDAATGRLFVTGKNWPRLFEIELVR